MYGEVHLTDCDAREKKQALIVTYDNMRDQEGACLVSIRGIYERGPKALKEPLLLATKDPAPSNKMGETSNLFNLIILDPGLYDLPCRDVNVTNGAVLNQGPAPFFLHGDVIRVRCDKGFGVEDLEYGREYEVVCSFRLQLLDCVRVPDRNISLIMKTKEECSGCLAVAGMIETHFQDLCLMTTILFVLSVTCVVLLLLLIPMFIWIRCSHRHKIRALEDELERKINSSKTY